jgi:hypothetical protein
MLDTQIADLEQQIKSAIAQEKCKLVSSLSHAGVSEQSSRSPMNERLLSRVRL